MRCGICIIGQEGVTWSQWCALAETCEANGIETLFTSDHYISSYDETGRVAHDAWTTIAGLAGRTSTLRFGTLVTPVTFREPALLANQVATIDHISGGRVELAFGGGWLEREHRAFGFPFPEMRTRLEMLAEQIEIVHRLWTDERVDFHGNHYTLENAPGQPKPLQQPRPNLIVGGSGKRATAEPAARFADEYNSAFVSPEEAARNRRRVRSACETVGRDPETMRFSVVIHCVVGRTRNEALDRAREIYEAVPREETWDDWFAAYTRYRIVDSIEETVRRLDEYVRIGCDRIVVIPPMPSDLEAIRLIGRELIPQIGQAVP